MKVVYDAMGDAAAEVFEVVTDGTVLALRIHILGTQTGPLRTPAGELPATGRAVRVEVTSFERYDISGRIREELRVSDASALVHQVGTT